MKVIGLTGNAGSGKSTVRKYYEAQGVPCLDADLVAHEIYDRQPQVVEQLVQEFGAQIIKDGKISRPNLAEIAFASKESTQKLNSIVHPAVFDQIQEWLQSQRDFQPQPEKVIVEASLIIEAGRQEFYDEIWMVMVEPDVQQARLLERGWTLVQIQDRLSKQLSQEEKAKSASKLIQNSLDLRSLFLQL